MAERSKLVRMRIRNIGCVGPEGLTIDLDNIVCLVGANNTGKSTVLHAYELALGSQGFKLDKDLCKRANDFVASVELWVHIPRGTANIAEKWKTEEDGYLLVRSRWEWAQANGWNRNRQTWDPEIDDYSADDKASGLDTVFESRLPQPFRVGTLEEPEEEHKKLLTFILQPVAERLKTLQEDKESLLNKALAQVQTEAEAPVKEESARLTTLKADLNRSHNAIFPDLQIGFEIGLGELDLDPMKLLLKQSHIKFREWEKDIDWTRQGTGSQRALFWTMLQVRSRLNALADIAQRTKKQIADGQKQMQKLEKAADKVKKDETKERKQQEIRTIEEQIEDLKGKDPERVLEERGAELALPGYMLLIDEPEVALHPNAIRAASDYLYGLADDPAWQVMLSTHSPQFIDPLKDHTTIVRLDRTQNNPSPRSFRSDAVQFTDEERDNLKMLNRFDTDLAEMFFGQYPVLVEGDTEFAAFQHIMHIDSSKFPVHSRPVLVRARGKYTLAPIIRMLTHFKVGFSVLHDSDWPRRTDGGKNNAWTANETLWRLITLAREAGLRVLHRLSVPTFELAHLPVQVMEDGTLEDTSSDNKPWNMVDALRANGDVTKSVGCVLSDLLDRNAREEPFDSDLREGLANGLKTWVDRNGVHDTRFSVHD